MVDREKHREYIKAFHRYNKGFLPNAGGTLDQPYKFWRVIETIDKTLIKIEDEEKSVLGQKP